MLKGDNEAILSRTRLGIVVNEFFDKSLGRMGGFGWAARQMVTLFKRNPQAGVDAVLLSGELGEPGQRETVVHETGLIFQLPDGNEYRSRLHAEHLDLLVTIDYRPGYKRILDLLPKTPAIVWVRDPRPPSDVAKIQTLRIPGAEEVPPQAISPIDCTSLAALVRRSRWSRRKILFATPALPLCDKAAGAYGVKARRPTLLPNILDKAVAPISKSPSPKVVFLGRLDPIKRPWLFCELARDFPAVEFVFLGQSHCHGPGAWEPRGGPPNVSLLGHVNDTQKRELLGAAWVLVNTSIHEALPVSFLEALLHETPILSCQDGAAIASRFGIYVGRWDGSGMEALPHFQQGLQKLLADEQLRQRLGKEGRQWVEQTHCQERFLAAFCDLCRLAGLPLPG